MNHVHLALGAAIVALAIIGLCWVLARVADGLERAWDWLSWRFRGADEDDYTEGVDSDAPHPYCILHDQPLDWCNPPHDDPLADALPPLPPERSREELGFTGEHPRLISPQTVELNHPSRERRAPWWEVQQRAAYESLGLDYPSGLLARIREQA